MEVLSALLMAFILTFSLPAPGEANKICVPAMDCITLDFQQTLVKDDVRELCRLLPDVLTCIDNALEECGDDVDSSVGQQLQTIRSKAAACTGGGSDSATVDSGMLSSECSEAALTSCISPEQKTASEQKDVEAVCRGMPSAMACAQATLDRCRTKKNADQMKLFVNNLKTTAEATCGGNSASAVHFPGLTALLAVLLACWVHRWLVRLD